VATSPSRPEQNVLRYSCCELHLCKRNNVSWYT
jgi:hypothetical protein